ncbi:FG-GAP-like repeat-containing protein [Streptomyces justiciae]|uniref:FG-GAP-like repeat-containing protein n=1 Tax=Streptomyces justiciae TaxID=2780140 RepID=A0ABU3LNB8_9ACTN|nr:FG-GAP-like repeat-containing protein [Streptomyces justiciae]MDT7840737.1 FG-GAP-like repeat-containing protein [Streptomyces justiciae]
MSLSRLVRHARRPVLALLAAGAVLSAPLPAAHAVVGTPTPAGTHAFTAHLDIGGNGTRACSAALVAPEWLVTAASCFAEDPQSGTAPAAGTPRLKTVATIGRTDLSGTGGHVAEVTYIVPRAGRDLVFARLATPATGITPVSLAASAPAAGDDLTVLGYGRTKTEWVSDKLHQANYSLDAVADGTLAMSGRTADDSVCKGDTGGPVLRTTGSGTYELVAVNSRAWQGGCLGSSETRTGAVAARTDGRAGGATIAAGQTLASGDVLLSKSAKVTMGTDGNLTVASNAGKTLWSSKTAGNPGATATLTTSGNLVVKSAAGTTLWESKTSAPGGSATLQDRGNLVVRTASGASLWSSNTVVRNDLSGDGRSDLAVWYDFADGRDAVNTFLTAPDGTFLAPRNGWITTTDTWTAANAKMLTGDYNGDGLADVAGVYGYSDGTVGIWTWLAKGNGTYATPFRTWKSEAGDWTFSRAGFVSGDFDGDGRDDLAAWYDYAAGQDRLFTFRSTAAGGFDAPTASLTIAAGGWTAGNAKLVTGDHNGDGRDDISAFYVYDSGLARIWSFHATTDGGFASGVKGWEGATWGERDRTSVYAGDFDGDGRDDLAAWYEYSDDTDGVHTWLSDSGGLLTTHKASARLAAGKVVRGSMKLAAGDYDGDGRDDLAFLHGYDTGMVRMWTLPALSDGTFGAYTGGWASSGTSWTFSRVGVIERYPA